jgi:pyruvate dehydrogenase E1 component alpha subunit
MHIADPASGNLGANAIVAGSAGIATGAAFSAKWRQTDRVAVCFFGEGALGQGVLYEVMNLAQLWTLPVIYVCENNLYNEYTHYSETTAGDILARPAAFGVHGEQVDGQDVVAVFTATTKLVARAREEQEPAFLLCHTYRYRGHHVGDINRAFYRSKEEEQEWATQHDPIKRFTAWLSEAGFATPADLERIGARVSAEIDAAVESALDAPYPDAGDVGRYAYA